MMKHSCGAIAIVALLATCVIGGVTIEVQPTATVSGAFVRLGDVALIQDDASGKLTTLVLCTSPLEGQSQSVTGKRIRRRVEAVLGSTDFTLSGLDTCVVQRVAAEGMKVESSADAATPTAAGAAAAGHPRVLGAYIRDFVAKRLEQTSGTVRIDFDPKDSDLLAVADDRYKFKLISATNQVTPGPQSLRIHMFERGKPRLVARSSVVKFTVVLTETVVVTAQSIPVGRIIKSQDVKTEQREFRSRPPVLLRRTEYVVGATAKRAIDAGRMVGLADLKKTLMVLRGKVVTVHMIGRGFRIKAVCKALDSGELGSAVAVQGVDGRSKFYAIVTGPREAEVRMPGATSAVRHSAADPASDAEKVAAATAVSLDSRATTNTGDQ